MPRLNINKIFGSNYHYYQDWGWGDYCDDLPFRESFRTHEIMIEGWGLFEDRKIKVNGINLSKIVDRIIENNIGESFDEAYSYYCRLIPKSTPDRYYEFMNNFEKPYPYYHIDEFGIIQNNEFWERRKGNKIKKTSLTKRKNWEYLDKRKKMIRDKKKWERNRKYNFERISFLTEGVVSNHNPLHIVIT